MKLVITGASGFIGKPLVQSFLAKKADLLLVGRDPEKLRNLFPNIECCSYDDLPARGKGYDGILHLAVLNNNMTATPEEFIRVNVDLFSEIIKASKNANIHRLVNISPIQALDSRNKSPYATSKKLAALKAKAVDGIEVKTLYLAAVIGDHLTGRLAILNHFPQPVRGVLLGLLSALSPTVNIDLVIEACWQAISGNDEPQQRIITNNQSKNLAFRALKRSMDLAGALIVLVPFCWLLVLIWIVIRLQSAGPGIFVQQRIGKNGKIFACYKFRTMQKNTPNVGTHEASVAMVTPIGHFLRRTKLDELPQAVNILLNQMSLVGPRPSLPNQMAVIEQRKNHGVLTIKPGITGLAQINQIDMSQPELLAQMDARYVKLRSLKLDLNILLATALGRGAGDAIDQANRTDP